MRSGFFYFIIFFTGLLGAGCNVVNPSENVPTYVQVDSFIMQDVDPVRTGSISHEIPSVWVFFNNQAVGAYELPALIPIVTTGPGTVQLVPAIAFNATTSKVQQYPFYEPDTISIPYKPGEATRVAPKTRYRSNARIWYVDFESGNKFIETNSGDPEDTLLVRTEDKDKVFEGKGSGYIYLNAAQGHPSSEVIASEGFNIVRGQSYLEINYRCTVPFEIGLQTTTNNGQFVADYIYGLNPTDTWKKAYVTLQDFVTDFQGTTYRLLLRSRLSSSQQEGYVLIDNVKIVSF